VERRKTVIKAYQLPAWFAAVNDLDSGTVRDFLLLSLFTGLRKGEAARLTWDRVDLTDRTLIVADTKNHDDHVLPLPTYLLELLTRRKGKADALPERSRYVFPGEGKTGYLIEPRKQIAHVIARSGVTFTPHDLRRTFITLAESLDIPAYALKRLLNHRMSGDVTSGYIVADVERLRRPMQQIEDFILKAAGVKAPADVVDIARIQRASA
jgi:integrase